MKHIIEDNGSEVISIITDEARVALKQVFRGPLPPEINRYKVTILSEEGVRHLAPILTSWLKNKVDNSLDEP